MEWLVSETSKLLRASSSLIGCCIYMAEFHKKLSKLLLQEKQKINKIEF